MKEAIPRKIDKNLEEALSRIKEESDIDIGFHEQSSGDNYIIIRTKTYETKIGANELGFWLMYDRRYK